MTARSPRTRPVALTGTPGTGKSTVAALLPASVGWAEVGTLAREVGCASGTGRQLVVDLARLRRRWARRPPDVDVVVGHLAHLLPVRQAIVLRCHPLELGRRLSRARRGTVRDRQANVVCEATDVVAAEARASHVPVYEIDTTGRSPRSVAREVGRRLGGKGPRRGTAVDWLADPTVTEQLLEPSR